MKKNKRSKGRQKSKAALLTAKAKEEQLEQTSSETSLGDREYSGGVMSKMRGGFKAAVSTEEQAKGGWGNIVLWLAVIGASVFFFAGQYQ